MIGKFDIHRAKGTTLLIATPYRKNIYSHDRPHSNMTQYIDDDNDDVDCMVIVTA